VSSRVGLRFISLARFLRRVKYHLAELLIYIIRRRIASRVLYYLKPSDRYGYSQVSRVSIALQETSSTSDSVSSVSASRMYQTLQEFSSSSDTYSVSEATRQVVELRDAVSSSDASTQPQAQRLVSSLQEVSTSSDSLKTAQAEKIVGLGRDSSASSDKLSLVFSYKNIISRRERTKTYEVSILEAPYPEDPTKTIYTTSDFEISKTLDELLWYYYLDNVRIGGYTDPSGATYNYDMRILGEQTSESDATSQNVYTQWIEAILTYHSYIKTAGIYTTAKTLYRGVATGGIYTTAKTLYRGVATGGIYTTAKTLYRGFNVTLHIYTVAKTLYHGYVATSVASK